MSSPYLLYPIDFFVTARQNKQVLDITIGSEHLVPLVSMVDIR